MESQAVRSSSHAVYLLRLHVVFVTKYRRPVLTVRTLKFLEKAFGFTGKYLMPELTKAFAAQVGSANIKVVVNNKTSFRVNSGPEGITFGPAKSDSLAQSGAMETPKLIESSAASSVFGGTVSSRPITPESSNTWKVFLVVLAGAIVGGLMYFFFQHR